MDKLVARNVTANQVTIAALGLSLVTGIFVWIGSYFLPLLVLVPAMLFLRMALNAIDGMLAREHNMKSDLGGYLNELGDLLSDAMIYLPFSLIPGISSVLVVSLVILALVSECAGILAVQIGQERRYDGPMGKSDRALVFGIFSLLLGFGVQVGVWVHVMLVGILGLLCLTISNRVKNALIVKSG